MTKLFTAEDFLYPVGIGYKDAHEVLAAQANAKLAPLMEALEKYNVAQKENPGVLSAELIHGMAIVLTEYRRLTEGK